MRIKQIRALIEEGKGIERQSGVLRRAVISLAKLNGVSISGPEVAKVVEFVTEYIEHAPALMTVIEEAATKNEVLADVRPILDASEEYFLATDDIIPDHYGLVGLLDDAYLTHSLMEAISDRYKSECGKSLLPMEAHELNTFIRRLIGAPFVSILDERVSTTFNDLTVKQNIDRMLGALAQMNLSSVPDPVWGESGLPEITASRLVATG